MPGDDSVKLSKKPHTEPARVQAMQASLQAFEQAFRREYDAAVKRVTVAGALRADARVKQRVADDSVRAQQRSEALPGALAAGVVGLSPEILRGEHLNTKESDLPYASREKRARDDILLGLTPRMPRSDAELADRQNFHRRCARGLDVRLLASERLVDGTGAYISYIIYASAAGRESLRTRRFKAFRTLDRALRKQLPRDTPALPPPSSKFGRRDLTAAFVEQRQRSLSDYLACLVRAPAAADDPRFLDFVGLPSSSTSSSNSGNGDSGNASSSTGISSGTTGSSGSGNGGNGGNGDSGNNANGGVVEDSEEEEKEIYDNALAALKQSYGTWREGHDNDPGVRLEELAEKAVLHAAFPEYFDSDGNLRTSSSSSSSTIIADAEAPVRRAVHAAVAPEVERFVSEARASSQQLQRSLAQLAATQLAPLEEALTSLRCACLASLRDTFAASLGPGLLQALSQVFAGAAPPVFRAVSSLLAFFVSPAAAGGATQSAALCDAVAKDASIPNTEAALSSLADRVANVSNVLREAVRSSLGQDLQSNLKKQFVKPSSEASTSSTSENGIDVEKVISEGIESVGDLCGCMDSIMSSGLVMVLNPHLWVGALRQLIDVRGEMAAVPLDNFRINMYAVFSAKRTAVRRVLAEAYWDVRASVRRTVVELTAPGNCPRGLSQTSEFLAEAGIAMFEALHTRAIEKVYSRLCDNIWGAATVPRGTEEPTSEKIVAEAFEKAVREYFAEFPTMFRNAVIQFFCGLLAEALLPAFFAHAAAPMLPELTTKTKTLIPASLESSVSVYYALLDASRDFLKEIAAQALVQNAPLLAGELKLATNVPAEPLDLTTVLHILGLTAPIAPLNFPSMSQVKSSSTTTSTNPNVAAAGSSSGGSSANDDDSQKSVVPSLPGAEIDTSVSAPATESAPATTSTATSATNSPDLTTSAASTTTTTTTTTNPTAEEGSVSQQEQQKEEDGKQEEQQQQQKEGSGVEGAEEQGATTEGNGGAQTEEEHVPSMGSPVFNIPTVNYSEDPSDDDL